MSAIADTIVNFFRGDGDSVVGYLGTISLVGGVAMGLVQSIKDTTPLRRAYNEWRVKRWLTAHTPPTNARTARIAEVTSALSVFGADKGDMETFAATVVATTNEALLKQLLSLAVDGDSEALFELEADQMVAQIKSAYASAIDAPHKYGALIVLASSIVEPEDLAIVLAGPVLSKSESRTTRARYSDARTRVYQQFERAADALLIKLSFRWRRLLQALAFVVCFLIALIILETGSTNLERYTMLGEAFLTGLLAAFFAPIARDVVAAVGQLRKL
jgi:hypothetical protein